MSTYFMTEAASDVAAASVCVRSAWGSSAPRPRASSAPVWPMPSSVRDTRLEGYRSDQLRARHLSRPRNP